MDPEPLTSTHIAYVAVAVLRAAALAGCAPGAGPERAPRSCIVFAAGGCSTPALVVCRKACALWRWWQWQFATQKARVISFTFAASRLAGSCYTQCVR